MKWISQILKKYIYKEERIKEEIKTISESMDSNIKDIICINSNNIIEDELLSEVCEEIEWCSDRKSKIHINFFHYKKKIDKDWIIGNTNDQMGIFFGFEDITDAFIFKIKFGDNDDN